MSNERFHPIVKEALVQAGWHPKRAVEESVLEKWYAFPFHHLPLWHRIHPRALKALREFGGLSVSVLPDLPGMDDIEDYRISIEIDPLRTNGYEDYSWIMHEWLSEQALFPLGVWGPSQDEVLAMSYDGKVFSLFAGIMSGICLVGNDFDEALLNILAGGKVLRLMTIDDEREKEAQAVKIKRFIERIALD